MSILTDFQAAAVEIFDTFESVAIDATYIKDTSSYVPGGNTVISSAEYSVRLIRDDSKDSLTLQSVGSLAEDVTFKSLKYLLIVAELAVTPTVKDKIKVGTDTKVILAIENDPGGVVATLFVG